MRKKVKYLFKVMALIMILSMILPTGLSVSQTKVFASTPVYFTDVKETDWFYKDVMELIKRGLIAGYPDKTFRPNAQIRVNEFTKILVSTIDNNIKTSPNAHWAEGYINKAKELGIIKNGEFSDYNRYITRGEMARMIVLAGERVKDKGLSLDVPENYKEYSYLITDYSTLDPDSKDIALKVFVSGIITGFPDGSFGFGKNATRAEACTILMRFLEKNQRKIPQLPIDLSNTLSVREFTTQLLKAIGKEATMEYAYEKGYVRSSAEYPSYEKPILRREAALTMARIMDELTNMPALFTSGDNDLFIQGYTRNHKLQPYEINILINNIDKQYFTLVYWENYRGHIKDIRMITPNYQKEMVTLYLAGMIDANENKELRPYDFLTKEEAQEWINKCKEYSSLSSDEVLSKLAVNIRKLEEKPMPEVEKPSNAEIWRSTSPYVNKRLYEYPLKLDKEKYSMFNFYNTEITTDTLKEYKLVNELYFNNRYTVDYRTLDVQSKYYSPYGGGISGIGDYKTRVLFYHNPGHPVNSYVDEKGNKRKIEDMIFADEALKQEIEKYKKYKVVSQAELITDESLGYINMVDFMVRATLRIIYYPPTDPVFLKEQGLEAGKWYEKDILIDMVYSVDGVREFKKRWEFSPINYTKHYDLSSFRPMEYLK